MTITRPPGQRSGWLEVMRILLSGQKFDQLAFVTYTSETYGGLSYTEFGSIAFYTVSDPDLMHEILVEKADRFHKGQVMTSVFVPIVGNGLLTSEGEFWKRQRKLAQPAFHSRRIDAYADTMVRFAQAMLDQWPADGLVQINREMMKVTLQIVAKTLFDADVTGDAERIGALLTEVLEAANARMSATLRIPDTLPTPARAAQRSRMAELDAIIQRIINERRASGEDRGDFLSMLLQAQDDDGSGMTDRQLRDEAMTIFLAGHETTANALTWALYLLSQHPEWVDKLRGEIDATLGNRPASVADLGRLPLTEMVIKETLRLYPPAPGVSRSPLEDVEIGGYIVPKNAIMQLSVYAMQRSARYWEDPLAFHPERFSPENEKSIRRHAYLPFGAGPRVCIGNSFALMEARLILATILQRAEVTLEPGQQVEGQQLLTLRPKHSITMRVRPRRHQTEPASAEPALS